MSLRTRLTLLFAALAGLSVLAAALVGYQSTASRVRTEIDETLRVGVMRAVGPGAEGRLCLGGGDVAPSGRRIDGRRRGLDLADSRLQCIDVDGNVISNGFGPGDGGSGSLPVDDIDRALAKQGNAIRLRTATADGTSLRIATAPIRFGGAVMLARDLDESNRVLDALRQRFALIGIAVVAVAAAVGALASRAFARPIRALTGVTESITSEGALSDHMAIDESIAMRRDEIGRLAASFSSMLGSLRSSRRQQRQLAQDAGHELRTPLTSLRTNVDVLTKYPELATEKRLAVLREMDAELRELSALTDELLVLATDATPDDPVGDVDLFELTQRAVDRLERRSGRTVQLVGPAEGTNVIAGRRIQLSRAIDNVFANAAKFDHTTRPIEVSVADNSVTVRDHGPGFVAADLSRVFDRFYRSDTARQLPGTGLGLSIAAEAARAHGGSATATNHPEGGASVTLRFGNAIPDATSNANHNATPNL